MVLVIGGLVAFVFTTAVLLTLTLLDVDYPPGTALVMLFTVGNWVQRRVGDALERADLEIAMRSDAST